MLWIAWRSSSMKFRVLTDDRAFVSREITSFSCISYVRSGSGSHEKWRGALPIASLGNSWSLVWYGLREAREEFDLKNDFSLTLLSLVEMRTYSSSNQVSINVLTTGDKEKESAWGATGLNSEVRRRERRDGNKWSVLATVASLCLQIKTMNSRNDCFTSEVSSSCSSLSSYKILHNQLPVVKKYLAYRH